jgi:hypothetical protein
MSRQFFTMKMAADISKYAPQTIYNKIYRKELIEHVHYTKPSQKRLLFTEQGIEKLTCSFQFETEDTKTVACEQPAKVKANNSFVETSGLKERLIKRKVVA